MIVLIPLIPVQTLSSGGLQIQGWPNAYIHFFGIYFSLISLASGGLPIQGCPNAYILHF